MNKTDGESKLIKHCKENVIKLFSIVVDHFIQTTQDEECNDTWFDQSSFTKCS